MKKTHTDQSNARSTPSGVKTGGFEMWRLTKVDNDNEHSMVEKMVGNITSVKVAIHLIGKYVVCIAPISLVQNM